MAHRILSKKDRIEMLVDLAKVYATSVHTKEHLKTFPKTIWTDCPHADCRRAVTILKELA